MVLFLIQAALTLIPLMGYMLYLNKKGIEIAFTPVLTLSGIGLVMFLAGLLNLMAYAVPVVFAGGIFCMLRMAPKGRRSEFSAKTGMVLSFFLILCLFLGFRLYHSEPSWPDNFTHWCVVVKDMLKTDRLPDAQSVLVHFQSYPTGTAGILYLFCKVLDSRDGTMLFAQSVILVSCLCALWAFVKKNWFLSGAVVALASFYLLGINISVSELCVDTLLSLLTIASFAILFYYRKDRKKAAILNCVVVSYLILVKTSGLLFMLLHALLLILMEYCENRSLNQAHSWKRYGFLALLSAGIPLAFYFLWNFHVKLSFPAVDSSPHNLSLNYMLGIFLSKGRNEVVAILKAFLFRFFHPQEERFAFIAVPAVYLFICSMKRFRKKQSCRTAATLLIWCIFVYGCYMAGMLAMYLFSMPLVDALELGSYGRYLYAATMYAIGIAVIYLLEEADNPDSPACWAKPAAAAMLTFLIITAPVRLTTVFWDVLDHSATDKHVIKTMKANYSIPDDARCFIATTSSDHWLTLQASYELWTADLEIGNSQTGSYGHVMTDYDYLLVLQEGAALNQFLQENGLPSGQSVYLLSEYR